MLQIIDNSATIRMLDGEPLEAAITKGAHHPNVVRTIDFAVTSAAAADADADADSDAAPERFDSATSHHKHRQGNSETWMLLEFCDCGSLQVRTTTSCTDYWIIQPPPIPHLCTRFQTCGRGVSWQSHQIRKPIDA